MSRDFIKMNGLGNDFVVVDARAAPFVPTLDGVRVLADRTGGVGCDQLVVIEPSAAAGAFIRIWNADGHEVSACGNATRCVAWLLMQETGDGVAVIETRAGLLHAAAAGEQRVAVDMGAPQLDWRAIPLAEALDTRGIELAIGPSDAPTLHTPGCVGMGNPHVVFFVTDAAAAPVREVGPMIEHHPLFPEGVNVGFAQVEAPDAIKLRVWERGAGETPACGTGACAAVVAAVRRGLCGRRVDVTLPGGTLAIEWRATDDHVIMTGAVATEFRGVLA